MKMKPDYQAFEKIMETARQYAAENNTDLNCVTLVFFNGATIFLNDEVETARDYTESPKMLKATSRCPNGPCWS